MAISVPRDTMPVEGAAGGPVVSEVREARQLTCADIALVAGVAIEDVEAMERGETAAAMAMAMAMARVSSVLQRLV